MRHRDTTVLHSRNVKPADLGTEQYIPLVGQSIVLQPYISAKEANPTGWLLLPTAAYQTAAKTVGEDNG